MFGMGGGANDVVVNIKGDASSLEAAAGQAVTSMGTVKKAAIGMSVAGGALAAGGLAKSVTAFADFDSAMNESLAIMGEVSDTQRNEMSDAARQVAMETTFSAEEAGEAYYYLASAGMDAEQSIAAMPQVASFAQAGMFDLARATDIATDAQSALGMTVEDPKQNLENLTRVTDVLVGANTLANASVEQFGEAMTIAGGNARLAGYDVEETSAILAVFADQGIKGQKAGTQLNSMLQNMQLGAEKNAEAWEEVGVSMYDAEGNMRPMADVVADLEDATADMTTEQKNATLTQMGFNRQGRRGMLMLMGNSDAMREYEDELNNVGGITQEVAQKQLETFSAQLQLLKSAVTDIAITVGSVLVPALVSVTEPLLQATQRFAEWTDNGNEMKVTMALVTVAAQGLAVAIGTLSAPLLAAVAAVSALAYVFATDFWGIRSVTESAMGDVRDEFARLNDALGGTGSVVEWLRKLWDEHGGTVQQVITSTYARAIFMIPTAVGAVVDAIIWGIETANAIWAEHGAQITRIAEVAYWLVADIAQHAGGALVAGVRGVVNRLDRVWTAHRETLWHTAIGAYAALTPATDSALGLFLDTVESGLWDVVSLWFVHRAAVTRTIDRTFGRIGNRAAVGMVGLLEIVQDGLNYVAREFSNLSAAEIVEVVANDIIEAFVTIPPVVWSTVRAIMWAVNRLEDFWVNHGQTIKAVATATYSLILFAARSFADSLTAAIGSATEGSTDAFETAGDLWATAMDGTLGAIIDAVIAFGGRFADATAAALGRAIDRYLAFAEEVVGSSIIPDMFDAIIAVAQAAMTEFYTVIETGLAAIIGLFTDLFDTVRDRIGDAIARFREYATAVRDRLGAVRDRITAARDRIGEYADAVRDRLADIRGHLSDARDRIVGYANRVVERIGGAASDAFDDAADVVSDYGEAVSTAIGDAWSALAGYRNRLLVWKGAAATQFDTAAADVTGYADDVAAAIGDLTSDWSTHATDVRNTVNDRIAPALSDYANGVSGLEAGVALTLASAGAAWIGHNVDISGAVSGIRGALSRLVTYLGTVSGPSQIARDAIAKFGSTLLVTRRVLQPVTKLLGRLAPILLRLTPAFAVVTTAVALFAYAYEENLFGVRDTTDDVIEKIEGAYDDFAANLGDGIEASLAGVREFWAEHGEQIVRIIDTAMEIVDIVIGVGIGVAETTTQLALDAIYRLWDTHAGTLDKRLNEFFDAVEDLFDGSFGFILDLVEGGLNKQLGFWEDHDSDVEGVLSAAAATWLGVIETGFDLILTFVGSALTVMTHLIRAAGLIWEGDWGGAMNELEQAAETVWEDIKGFFRRALRRIDRIVERWSDTIVGEWADALGEMVQDAIDWGADMAREAREGMRSAKDEVISEIDDLIGSVGRKLGGLVDVWGAHFRNVKSAITGGIGDALGEYDVDDIDFGNISVDTDFGSGWEDHGATVSATLSGPIATAVNTYNRWMRTLREHVNAMLTRMSDAWDGHVITIQAVIARIRAEFDRLRSALSETATQTINGVAQAFGNGLSRLHTQVSAWFSTIEATVASKIDAAARAVDTGVGRMESGVQRTLATIQQVWHATFTGLYRTVSDWGGDIKRTVDGALDDIITEASTFGRTLADTITGALGTALQAFYDWGTSLIWGSVVPDIFADIISHVVGAMGDLEREIIGALDSLINAIGKKLSGLYAVWKSHVDQVADLIDRVIGGAVDTYNEKVGGVDLDGISVDFDFGTAWSDHGNEVQNTVNGPIATALNNYGRWINNHRDLLITALGIMSAGWLTHSTKVKNAATAVKNQLGQYMTTVRSAKSPTDSLRTALTLVATRLVTLGKRVSVAASNFKPYITRVTSATPKSNSLKTALSLLATRFLTLGKHIPAATSALKKFGPKIVGLHPGMRTLITLASLFGVAYKSNFLGVRDTVDATVERISTLMDDLDTKLRTVTEGVTSYIEGLWAEHGVQIRRIIRKGFALLEGIFDSAVFVIEEIVSFALETIGGLWEAHGERIIELYERYYAVLEEIVFIGLEIIKGYWRWLIATVQSIVEVGLPILLDYVEGRLDAMAQFWEDHGDTIEQIVIWMFNTLTSGIAAGMDLLLTAFTIGFDFITSALEAAVQIWEGDYSGALNTMLAWTGRTIADIQAFWERRFNAITAYLARWGSNLVGWFINVLRDMYNGTVEWLNASYDWWVRIFDGIYDKLARWGDNVAQFFTGIYNFIVNGAIDFGENIKEAIEGALDKALDAVINWISNLLGENDPRKTFDNIVSDIKETLGKLGIDSEAILAAITSIFTVWTNELRGDIVGKAFDGMRTDVAEALGATATTAGIGWEQVKGTTNTKLQQTRQIVGGWWESMKNRIGGVLDTINENLPGKWQLFVNDITGGAQDIHDDVTGDLERMRDRAGDLFFFLKQRVMEYFNPLIEDVTGGAQDIYDAITEDFRNARDNARDAAQKLKEWVLNRIDPLVEAIETAAETIEGAFDIAEEMEGYGRGMMTGLRDGINETKNEAIDAAQGAVSDIQNTLGEGLNLNEGGDHRLLIEAREKALREGRERGGGVVVGGGSPSFNAGAAIMSSMASGISSNAHLPANEMDSAMGDVRDYLPRSNAVVGPLSDLESTGPSIPETMADGIRSAANSVVRSLIQLLESVKRELGYIENAAEESMTRFETTLSTGAMAASNAVGRALLTLVAGTRRQMGQMESVVGKSIDTIESDLTKGALEAANAVGRAFVDMRSGSARTFEQMERVLTRTFDQMAQTVTRRAAELENDVSQITNTMRRRVTQEFERLRNSAMNATNTMVANVSARFSSMRSHLNSNATQMRNYVSARMSQMATQATNAMNRFRSAVVNGGNRAVTAARNTAIRMVNAVRSRISSFQNAGAAMMNALRRGIRRRGNRAVAAARDVARRVRRTMPSSDAKEGPLSDLTTVGPALVDTFAEGIESAADVPAAAAATMAANVKDVLSVTPDVAMAVNDGMPLRVSARTGSGETTHQTIIHVGAIHASGRKEGREVAVELKRLDREARRGGL